MAGISSHIKPWAARIIGEAIAVIAQLVTAARGIWQGTSPEPKQRVYFANHTSNGDFVLIWTALPRDMRAMTRPVAAADYWLTTKVRQFLGRDVFNAVLIQRDPERRVEDPVTQMVAALDEGASLILFPEGGRNQGEGLLPFKTGLYHLAKARPEVDLVPCFIRNLNRVLPKGEIVPVPLICTVTFGAPLHLAEGEEKSAFLARAEAAVRELGGMSLPAALPEVPS